MSEEIPRYLYCKADVWQNWRDSNIRRTIKNIEYSHLDLNISRIDFEHHWLFSAEDSSIQSARFLNEENIKLNAKVLKLVQKYLNLKQTLSANEYAIEEKSRYTYKREQRTLRYHVSLLLPSSLPFSIFKPLNVAPYEWSSGCCQSQQPEAGTPCQGLRTKNNENKLKNGSKVSVVN